MIYIHIVVLQPSFFEIGPPDSEKKIFEGFLPYMGMAAIWSCELDNLYIH